MIMIRNPQSAGASPAKRVSTGLAKIGMALKSRGWSSAGQHGLTPTQAQILTFLDATSSGPVSLGDIAAGLAITPPTASDSVATLVDKGLLEKRRSTADRRVALMTLTDRGRSLAREISDWTDFLASAVDTLDPDEQAVFARGLVKIIRTLQVRGQIPPSRMCVTCRFFRPNAHAGQAAPHHCDYVDMPFGDRELRIDCADHDAADQAWQSELWSAFLATGSIQAINNGEIS